jgi:ATP-dependent Zn protease
MRLLPRLKSIIRKIIPGSFPYKPEKYDIAYHEAGHAVARYCLKLPISIVSIVQQEDYRGYADYPADWRDDVVKKREDEIQLAWENRIFQLMPYVHIEKLCGGIAEEKYLKRPNPDGMRSDIDSVKFGIQDMISFKRLDENESETYFDNLFNCAKQLMEDPNNWRAVESLADALLKSKELTGEEVQKIIDTILNRPE